MAKSGNKGKRGVGKRKEVEKELRLSEIKLKELFDSISSGVAVYQAINDGEDFVFVDFNRAAERIEKIKKEEILGKSIVEVFPGIKNFGLFEVFQRVWKTGSPEYHPASRYNDERIVGWRENHVYKLPSGEIVAVYDDVTERKRAEQALKMSEQCFHAIADYSYFWEIWVNPAGRPVWTNPAVQRVTGYSIKELMALPDYPMPLVYEEDRTKVGRAFKSAMKGGKGKEVEFRLLKKDGTVIWVEMSWQPIYDDRNISIGHRTSIRDISERKKARDGLQVTQFCLDHAADPVFWIEPNAGFVYVNDAACRTLGYSRDELLSMTVHDIDPNFPQEAWAEHWEQVRSRGSSTFESSHCTKDGRVFPTEITINYLNYDGKEYNCVFARDITERKQAEHARDKLNKELESILYAASHDLKTPLINIQGFGYELARNCEMIRSALTDKSKNANAKKLVDSALNKDIPEALDFISSSTSKMDSLLSGLLDLCHLGTAEMLIEPVDMNTVMTDVVANMEYRIKQRCAQVEVESVPSCLGDASKISRIFTNLLANALKFLDKSRPGRICISGKSQNEQSVYCIEDNGIGIATEHQEKIFEIFYQLEPDKRKGEGLGLAIVGRILDKHNGEIWVESKPGEGSKFFVFLPNA